MSIEVLTHYRVTCDGKDCFEVIPEMVATHINGLYLDLRNRGWRVIPYQEVLCPACVYLVVRQQLKEWPPKEWKS